MKLIFLAGVALIAAPALAQTQTTPAPSGDMPAQTTPPATPPADTQSQPPAPNSGVPNTALSTSPTPSDGPRAQQGNMPSNSAAAGANADASASTTTTTAVTPTPDGSAVVETGTSANPPAPAAMDHYPICKAGQFTGCMEPGHGSGGHKATRRKHR